MRKRIREYQAARRASSFPFSTGRDDLFIASAPSDLAFEPVSRALPQNSVEDAYNDFYNAVRSTLSEVEDRRNYHPQGRARSAQSSGRHPKIKAIAAKLFSPVVRVGFSAPKNVAVCVRRHQRAEVLHALGRTGRGHKQRKPRFNSYSSVRC